MLYPKKIDAKKGSKLVKILLIISACLSILLIFLNKITTPHMHWGVLAVACIVYIWVTVLYALKKNKNIAAHILVQVVAISLLLIAIDYALGFEKWSLEIAMPIIIITANLIMTILTLISYKKYIRYVVYQLILILISMTPMLLITEHYIADSMLSRIAIWISIVNFILCVALCSKDMKAELKRKFHM